MLKMSYLQSLVLTPKLLSRCSFLLFVKTLNVLETFDFKLHLIIHTSMHSFKKMSLIQHTCEFVVYWVLKIFHNKS